MVQKIMATKTKAEIEAETKAAEAKVDNEEAERVALLVPTTIYSQASNDCVIPRYKETCLLYTSPSPRDRTRSRMPSSA